MRIHSHIILAGLIALAACQRFNRNEKSTISEVQKYCFLRLEGTQLQDSSYIQLTMRNEMVSGTYQVVPHEKDARRGTVTGKQVDGIFDLVWTFSQEGRQDSLRVVFKLQEGKLLRKPLTVDTLTGRQMTLDTSNFSEVYEPVDCASMTAAGYAGSQ